jgi:hypothetical protein
MSTLAIQVLSKSISIDPYTSSPNIQLTHLVARKGFGRHIWNLNPLDIPLLQQVRLTPARPPPEIGS